MATKTFEELKQLDIQIRDEKTNKQNTATRVGTAMLEHINKLEQDYYDKTQTDEELKERDDKLTELEENLHDIEGNLHGNIYDIPAFVSGSKKNYKCYFKKDDLFSINIECNSSLKIFLKDESGNNVPFYHDGTLKTIIESDGNGDYTVIPQSDVYYIRVTDNVDNCNLTIKSIRRTIAELEDYLGADIEAEKEKLSYKSYVTVDYNDKYITTGGNINIGDTVDTLSFTELPKCKCIIKNIEGNQKFYIKGQCGDAYRLYAFLDENNNLLERSKTNISGEFSIKSPINSKKAIFCFIGDGYVYEQSSITYKNLQYLLYRHKYITSILAYSKKSSFLNYDCTFRKNIIYKLNITSSSSFKIFARKADGNSTLPIYSYDGSVISGMNLKEGIYYIYVTEDASFIRVTDNYYDNVYIEIYESSEYSDNDIIDKNKELECISYFGDTLQALQSCCNGIKLKDELNSNIIATLKQSGYDYSVHDSAIVIKNDIAYVVYMANTSDTGGDNAGTDTCVVKLAKFNLNNVQDTLSYYVVSCIDNTYGTVNITGGSGSPNIIPDETDDDILHIIYSGKADQNYVEITCDYRISSDNIENYRIVQASKDNSIETLNNKWINKEFNLSIGETAFNNMQANSTIGYYDGYYYIGLVFGYNSSINSVSCIIFKTKDFSTWEYVTDNVEMRISINSVFECACICDNNGYLYISIRPFYKISNEGTKTLPSSNLYGEVVKLKISSKEIVDRTYYRTVSSKTFFYKYNDEIYLITNVGNRRDAEIIKINKDELKSSTIIARIDNSSYSYFYAFVYNNIIYTSYSSSGISISKFNPIFEEKSIIEGKIKNIFDL